MSRSPMLYDFIECPYDKNHKVPSAKAAAHFEMCKRRQPVPEKQEPNLTERRVFVVRQTPHGLSLNARRIFRQGERLGCRNNLPTYDKEEIQKRRDFKKGERRRYAELMTLSKTSDHDN